ncbi:MULTISPECIES: electron transport complex subunit RsxC [unclassified Fusibacter]|uniref:electron transport complex subunit RsxC n=1 Tax=unclassified Fusibacter TaxID=2624464 RepID=UPI001012D844|nr:MULTISPECIES: electron transport complex subunit RsxC [unclassified Fusibacter]MCK8060659.1 electron transport complex subunit RsxC [Fusibacter sp. A2]NPE22887.1 electron transport complex subunit RsxC [Fusibacter sp. A1]RXV59955.1 electron transport complex subunit RsxC [Fusibacter sp. A1]
MGVLSFIGGIHPPHAKKSTEHKETVVAVEPKVVTIPLRQHIGAPCDPMVKKGDVVAVGQMIGEATSFVSAAVHSSVSGVVLDVAKKPTAGGMDVCVVIENDFKNTVHESVMPKGDLSALSGSDIIGIIKEGGIVGMGGAGFPLHVKLMPPKEKTIDTIILNGAECEPYLTADHRLMLETPDLVVQGLRALMKALDVKTGYIGIEDNKPDAIKEMKKAAQAYSEISVVGLHTKYPQGAEKQLIYACTKRQVPSGGLPMDVGAVVSNVATAAAVARLIQTGMPLVERICTVTGSAIKEPKNLLIKVGTPINELIDQCGGYATEPGKLILGGPMMGMAQAIDTVPSTKTTSGILVFNRQEGKLAEPEQCIQCGKCVSICPAFLQPCYISAYALKDDFEKAQSLHALDCIECGSCSFVCPSKRPLLQSIRVAKREILAKRRRSK